MSGTLGGVYGVVGGICGANYGIIRNCVNYGTISMLTQLNYSSTVNGIPGAICGAQLKRSEVYPHCDSCYWLEGCVQSNKGNEEETSLDSTNFMIFNPLLYNSGAPNLRNGIVSSCGYFPSLTNGALIEGNVYSCGSRQTLPKYDGTENNKNLIDALNGYVTEQGADTPLKGWKSDDNHAAVLDFGN